MRAIPYLKDAVAVHIAENTLVCSVEKEARVLISFFGGLDLKHVQEPETAVGNGVKIASLPDLAGCKVAVVQQRAAAKDYLDVAAVIRAGIDLPTALSAAGAIYGERFNPVVSLSALQSFDDGDLNQLDDSIRRELMSAAAAVRLARLPKVEAHAGLYGVAQG